MPVSTPYPLIDQDPHFARVLRYMRPSDYAAGVAVAAAGPGALFFMGEYGLYILSSEQLTVFLGDVAISLEVARMRLTERPAEVGGMKN